MRMGRRGDWFQTYTGQKFWPLDPDAMSVSIEDIAHALSLICRYGGHCREFYCVAQHSVIVRSLVSGKFARPALLHDAAEAYIGDMVRPLKRQPEMLAYRDAEDLILSAIRVRFNISPWLWEDAQAEVKKADNVALITEKRDLLTVDLEWGQIQGQEGNKPMAQQIVPWHWTRAQAEFLDAWRNAL